MEVSELDAEVVLCYYVFMKSASKTTLFSAVLLLVVAVVSFYTLSILTMQHHTSHDVMIDDCVMLTQTDPATNSLSSCLAYHIGLFSSLTQNTFQNHSIVLAMLLLGFVFSLYSIFYFDQRAFVSLWVKYKYSLQRQKEIFYNQLGYFLTILEKRDPSNAFLIA